MDLSHGGHLTHGSPVNMSGKWFNAVHYGVDKEINDIKEAELETRKLEMDKILLLENENMNLEHQVDQKLNNSYLNQQMKIWKNISVDDHEKEIESQNNLKMQIEVYKLKQTTLENSIHLREKQALEFQNQVQRLNQKIYLQETQEEHYKNLIQNIKNDMENSNLELLKQKEDLQNQINNFQNFNFQLVKEKKRVKK
jgi:hypothetical protein